MGYDVDVNYDAKTNKVGLNVSYGTNGTDNKSSVSGNVSLDIFTQQLLNAQKTSKSDSNDNISNAKQDEKTGNNSVKDITATINITSLFGKNTQLIIQALSAETGTGAGNIAELIAGSFTLPEDAQKVGRLVAIGEQLNQTNGQLSTDMANEIMALTGLQDTAVGQVAIGCQFVSKGINSIKKGQSLLQKANACANPFARAALYVAGAAMIAKGISELNTAKNHFEKAAKANGDANVKNNKWLNSLNMISGRLEQYGNVIDQIIKESREKENTDPANKENNGQEPNDVASTGLALTA